MSEIWTSPAFWYGVFYVTFPLNLLVYGWNDLVDATADSYNPRKDSFLFGARGTAQQLKKLPAAIILIQLACLPLLLYYMGLKFLILLAFFILINGLYNLP